VLLAAALAVPLGSCGPQAGADGHGEDAGAPGRQPAETRIEVPDALARLVPADAVAFVGLASLDEAERLLRDLTRAFDEREAERSTLRRTLLVLGVPGDFSHVDRTRPLVIAVSIDRKTRDTLLTVIAPVTDRERFEASVSRLATAADGDYLGASEVDGYAAGAEPSALARHLPPGALAVRVDLEALLGVYRATIDATVAGFLNLMRSSARGPGSRATDLGALLDAYADGIEAVLDSSERLDLGAWIDGDDLELAAEFLAVGGSPLGTLGSDEPTGIAGLADAVPADAQMVWLLGMDMVELGHRLEGFMTGMARVLPEPLQDTMSRLLADWDEIYAAMRSVTVSTVSFGEDGMRVAQVMRPPDIDAMFDVYRRMYTSGAMAASGMLREPPVETERDGVRVLSLRMDVLDVAMEAAGAFGAAPGRADGPPDGDDTPHGDDTPDGDGTPGDDGAPDGDGTRMPPDIEASTRAMLESMYGTDGVALRVASKGDRLAVLMGGDEAWAQAAIAGMDGGADVPASLREALARVERLSPCSVARLDVGGMIASWMTAMRPVLGEHFPDVGPLPPAHVTLSLGVAGRTWKGHATVDLPAFAEVTKALSGR
jgi:hypothetical protein